MAETSWSIWSDARRAVKEAPEGLVRRQRARLADQVAHARNHSPYYRQAYQDLPDRVEDPALLPVTSKTLLMERFDDWATDRQVTLDKVRSFVDDPALIGRRFLGEYLVTTTTGTSGHRGLFVHDDRELDITNLIGSRGYLTWLGARGMIKLLGRGMRIAQLGATGGHFVGYAGYLRATEDSRWRRRVIRSFSVHRPLPELTTALEEFRPAIVIGYASMIKVLAAEQNAGRLHIDPMFVVPAGETMTDADLHRIASAFHTEVRTVYTATECMFLSSGCAYGRNHVNSDWVIAEPVDADYRPTPPGEWSRTILISNLANRVQPILRYDLGDRVLAEPDPCPCGNPLPALRVEGRSGDTLTAPTAHGEQRTLTPLALSTLFDRTPGIELFQTVQTKPDVLRVRLRPNRDADPDRVWQAMHEQLTRLLADNDLGNVALERAEEPPEQAPGGKYRAVVPLAE